MKFVYLLLGSLLSCLGYAQLGGAAGLSRTQASNLFKPESKAQKFRRLLAAADLSNPSINPAALGSTPWTVSLSVPYAGYVVSNGGLCYQATGTGTTAASGGGPTGYTAGITDGSVTWNYIGLQTAPTMVINSAVPSYLTTQVKPNDPRIHWNGGVPITLTSTAAQIAPLSMGLGGSGGYSNGAINGATSLVNGYDYNDFGFDIVTDAPILAFQVNNSIPGFNVVVRDATTNAYIASYPMAGNQGIGDNYVTLDFTGIGSNMVGGGALTPTLTGSSLTGWTTVTAGQGYTAAYPPDIYFYGYTGSAPNAYAVINASGQLTAPTITAAGNITGGTLSAKVVTNRHKRRITFVSQGSSVLKDIWVASIDTVWASSTADHLTVSFLGDSWVNSIGVVDTVGRQSPMCVTFAQLIGADNWVVAGVGSTDYATPEVPINTTVTSGAISTGSQTVALSSVNATMGGGTNYPLLRGDSITFDYGLSTQETVVLSAVSGSNVTATFGKSHAAGCAATGYVDPFYCRTAVTSGAISTGSQTVVVGTVNNAKGSTSGIATNSLLWVDAEGTPEVVKVTGITGTSITGTFGLTHAAGCSIQHVGTGARINHYLRATDVAYPNSAVFANKSGDFGSGTCSAVGIGNSALSGTYTFSAISATNFRGILPSGVSLPALTVGQAYSYGGLSFTISTGATPYVAGDVFTITVTLSPDIIVIGPAGLNDTTTDGGASSSVIQTECNKLYRMIRANCPDAVILWYGCNTGLAGPTQVSVDTGIYNAIYPMMASDPLLLYVPVIGDPNGPWNLWTLAGESNPTTGHPSTKGFTYWGFRMLSDSVRDFFRQLVTKY